jgi:hypothetical protein
MSYRILGGLRADVGAVHLSLYGRSSTSRAKSAREVGHPAEDEKDLALPLFLIQLF